MAPLGKDSHSHSVRLLMSWATVTTSFNPCRHPLRSAQLSLPPSHGCRNWVPTACITRLNQTQAGWPQSLGLNLPTPPFPTWTFAQVSKPWLGQLGSSLWPCFPGTEYRGDSSFFQLHFWITLKWEECPGHPKEDTWSQHGGWESLWEHGGLDSGHR